MSNSTALDVMRVALRQYHYTESPPGSNRTKYGKWFGINGEPWCAEYVSWCGYHAPGDNPIALSANAADIQDITVKSKGGKYILKHTTNNSKKEAALSKIKFGDNVSFNFSGGWDREHTGLVIGVWGEYVYCIEGNTSFDSKGSQSNGGAVADRKRYYSTIVCVDRPPYSPFKFHEPSSRFTGIVPKLPGRGWFRYGDRGEQVARLQNALAWTNGIKLSRDGDFGSYTFAEVVIFQVAHGLEPDGQWGEKCQDKLEAIIKKHKSSASKKTVTTADKSVPAKKKTKAQKMNDRAIKDAWPKGTPKSKYRYPDGKPRKQYKKDLNEAYPNRKNWWKQTAAGAACDVFVPVIIRITGVDKKIPHGLEYMIPYLKKSKKFKKVKTKKVNGRKYYTPGIVKGGDFVVLMYKGGGAHTFFIVEKKGKKYIAEAQYHGKTYPHISGAFKSMRKSNYKMLVVYRAVE